MKRPLAALVIIMLLMAAGGCSDSKSDSDSIPISQYPEVKIGSQTWMAKNLDVGTFRNGDPIPEAKTDAEWDAAGDAKKPAWSYYDNDTANGTTYGKLYNWYAVNDSRGLCPQGWHEPTNAEWDTLVSYLGGQYVAGGKMKEAGTDHWESPNAGATNSSGFSALPAGARGIDEDFSFLGSGTGFWSTTEDEYHSDSMAYAWGLDYRHSVLPHFTGVKEGRFSVRCVLD